MSVILSYIFLGLSLSAPIGPINAAQLDKGIRCGFWHAWLVGLGAMMADALYMIMVYMGLVHFLSTPLIQTLLWSFGSFMLIYTGIDSLLGASSVAVVTKKKDDTLFKSFFSGFLMSLSNPLTILFWLGIYGSVLAKTASVYGTQELLVYSSAILLGIIAWDFSMAGMASTFRRLMTPRLLTGISVISGLSLIGFGLYFAVAACRLLF
ncbi:LysE family transporter [Paenibacillus sp. S-38]|uniref:LysE family transporter n=1 Tax=Paenibacillus sp. S-38 TaxID=3416710 RepID=UPI003CED522F